MHPILFDLSHWKPLGISLDSFTARAVAFALSAVVAYVAGMLLTWRRTGRPRRKGLAALADPFSLLAAALLAVSIVGLVWAIGKGHTYGLMLALGLIAGTAVATRLVRREGLPAQVVSSLALVALVAGILGARLAFVIEHWHELAGAEATPRPLTQILLDAASIASGGLVFDGGLILALLAVLAYLWRRRLPIRRFLDVIAIAAMIGLAFGRIGCFFNGCCYGRACPESWPLAVHYPYASSPLMYPHAQASPFPPGTRVSLVYSEQVRREEGVRVPPAVILGRVDGLAVLKQPDTLHSEDEIAAAQRAWSAPAHPAPLYASACDFLLAGTLWLLWRRRQVQGSVFAWMLVLYAAMRFGLELVRHDNPDMLLTPAQYKCIVLLGAGLVVLALMRRLARRELLAPGPAVAAAGERETQLEAPGVKSR